eukprot:TRINITY_DN48043_c0_g1_i1.p1 TRINITY_DN48043_c0_g1~~TRINITY_DN48043_c0_g1_i1.p1  ORF type:complete len:518 (+),score=91.41 TRINITY_DN48043_c0_g1_i1:100-1653(+)
MTRKVPDTKTSNGTTSSSQCLSFCSLLLVAASILLVFCVGLWLGYNLKNCEGPGANSSSIADTTSVISLRSVEFEAHLQKYTHTLVKFYAPWCGHCQKLAPDYAAAASVLKLQGISLAKVDATEETSIAAKYGVENYPTLLWFERGEKMDYSGEQPPTQQSIVEWATSMTRPAVGEVGTSDLPAAGTLPQVVLYNSVLTEAFQSAASANRLSANWYFVKDAASTAKIVLQHKGEDPIELRQFLEDRDAVANFFLKHSAPLVGELSGETFSKYTDKALIWSLFPVDSAGGMRAVLDEFKPMLTEIAKSVVGKYCVTYTDTVKFKDQIHGMLGVSQFPAIVIQPSAGSKTKYVYKGSMTASAFLKFMEDVDVGKVLPTLKSEPPPTSNKQPVRIVVADTLQQEVFVPDRDVLLEIFAPWCGSCKKLEPEYEKLAEYVQSRKLGDLVTIAKIDGTANDLPPEFEYNSFPTLYFARAGSNTLEKYSGERNAAGMWAWIEQRLTKQQDLQARFESDDSRPEL